MDPLEGRFPYASRGLLGIILGHWADPVEFVERLRQDPHHGLGMHGVDVPAGVEIDFAVNDKHGFHLRRPPARDSDLGRILGNPMVDANLFEALCGIMRCPLRSWSPVPLDDLANRYQAFLQSTRSDDALLARYVADPWSVLAEHGVDIPRTVPLKVLVDKPDLVHMVIPSPPSASRLREFLSRFPVDGSVST
ncbi:MAG: hypothetical protein GY895_03065 [Phycisphaera sp.]|nr:hypothetical protein [Phycisphaera sp.]